MRIRGYSPASIRGDVKGRGLFSGEEACGNFLLTEAGGEPEDTEDNADNGCVQDQDGRY